MSQQSALGIDQQIQLVREIARLVRARLPLEQTVAELAGKHRGNLGEAARLVDARLADGHSLKDSLAAGHSRSTRMLAAAIEIGQSANQLPPALESWTNYHIDSRRSRQRLNTTLVYPALLVVVMILSLVYTAWKLIPHYEQAYATLAQHRPAWLDSVRWIHQNLLLFTIAFLVAVTAIPLFWWLRGRSVDRRGVPRDPATRYYLHVHAARLAAIAVTSGHPLPEIFSSILRGCGGSATVTTEQAPAEKRIQNADAYALLGRECMLTLASLDAGIISPEQCVTFLHTVSQETERRASAQVDSDARWLPMLVALCVGLGVTVAYVGLIYLPWVALFQELALPSGP